MTALKRGAADRLPIVSDAAAPGRPVVRRVLLVAADPRVARVTEEWACGIGAIVLLPPNRPAVVAATLQPCALCLPFGFSAHVNGTFSPRKEGSFTFRHRPHSSHEIQLSAIRGLVFVGVSGAQLGGRIPSNGQKTLLLSGYELGD